MTAIVSFPGPSGQVDSLELRRNLAGLVVRDSSGNPRAGILPRSTSAIVSATANTGPMTVNVAAFEAVLVRQSGPLFMANDGTVSVSLSTAPVSNSRIDVIYARQNESAAPMSDGADTAVIAVATGTAAASPVKPSIPTGALELATVTIPSGVTASNAGGVVITQTYPYTAMTGGLVLVRDSTELAAWTPGDGSRAQRLDTYAEYERRAGVWRNTTGLLAEWHKNVSAGTAGGAGLASSGSTLAISSVPYARAIRVTVQGGYFPSADGDGGVSVVPSTGTWAGGTNTHRIKGSSSLFSDIAYVFYMASLPASTALTLTLTSVTSVTAGYDLHFIVEEV